MLRFALLLGIAALACGQVIIGVQQTLGVFNSTDRDRFIDMSEIFQAGTNRPLAEIPPQSARTLYYFWNPANKPGTPVLNPLPFTDFQPDPDITITWSTNPTNAQYKLAAPRLEVNPGDCPDASPQTQANLACRCVDPTGIQDFPLVEETPAGGAIDTVDVPTFNYFANAPVPFENPFLRTYRRLCASFTAGTGETVFVDTNVYVAVVFPCAGGAALLNLDPLFECSQQGAIDSRLRLASNGQFDATDLSLVGTLGAFLAPTGNSPFAPPGAEDAFYFGESAGQRNARLSRLTCCGATNFFDGTGVIAQPGICIDAAVSSCCGNIPYNPSFEQCCSRVSSRVSFVDDPCPCRSEPNLASDDCEAFGPNDIVPGNARGIVQGRALARDCCTVTKFPEFADPNLPKNGFCYDSSDTRRLACCDDGNVYDPRSTQCCPINGIQTLNLPCPCSLNSDCPSNHACCKQLFPLAVPQNEGSTQCNRFANFPNLIVNPSNQLLINGGTISPELTRCVGACYNLDWQICCNGVICNDQYERCCNATCCNKHTSTCVIGQRPGSLTSRFNPLYYHYYFELCSSVELISGRRAYLMFVVPTLLLIATLTGLALVAVVARRATEHIFELTEKAIVILAVFSVALSCAFFFSPIYKYGLVMAFLSLYAIAAVTVRVPSRVWWLIVFLVVVLLFILDPFNGNLYFSLPGAEVGETEGVAFSTSLIESAQRVWRNSDDCTDFYDFFTYDDNVRDAVRIDNPERTTFGYCSRGWSTALMIFACLLYITLLLMLLLAVFSLAKLKLLQVPAELPVIETEIVEELPFAPVGYAAPYGYAPPPVLL